MNFLEHFHIPIPDFDLGFGYTFFIAINHQDLKNGLKWEMMSLKTDDNWSYMKT